MTHSLETHQRSYEKLASAKHAAAAHKVVKKLAEANKPKAVSREPFSEEETNRYLKLP